MAINFLNSINLNQNELIKARVENQPNNAAAGTGVEGQLYYDTTADVLKVWANGAWKEVGGGVVSLGLANSTFVSLANSGTATDPIITASLSATGTPDSTKYLRGDNTWSAISGIYSFNVSDGATSSQVLNAETVTFSGTANEVTVAQASKTITIGLPNDVTVAGVLTVSGTGQSSFGGQVTIPTTPLADTDAASKAYVDASVAGGMIYQGGYNAATNTPNLDSPPTGLINQGFTWTVTADGLFFTEQVRIGDVLIAETDGPTILSDWTIVQNNVDLASLTQIGIGNVNAGTGVTVSYANGTATVSAILTSTTGTIAAGSLSGTVTHAFGINTLVQTVDSTGATVFCDVTRTSTTVVATVSAIQANPITILVQKIG